VMPFAPRIPRDVRAIFSASGVLFSFPTLHLLRPQHPFSSFSQPRWYASSVPL
jgi:hypothetical protein